MKRRIKYRIEENVFEFIGTIAELREETPNALILKIDYVKDPEVIWRWIKGYKGLYKISNKKEIMSAPKRLKDGSYFAGKILVQIFNVNVSNKIKLSRNVKQTEYSVDELFNQVFKDE